MLPTKNWNWCRVRLRMHAPFSRTRRIHKPSSVVTDIIALFAPFAYFVVECNRCDRRTAQRG